MAPKIAPILRKVTPTDDICNDELEENPPVWLVPKVKTNTAPSSYPKKCERCGKMLPDKNKWWYHKEKQKDCATPSSKKKKCVHPACNEHFYRRIDMIKHLQTVHTRSDIESVHLSFKTFEEFKAWKEEEETKKFARFSKSSATRTMPLAVRDDSGADSHKYHYFVCQRDGYKKPAERKTAIKRKPQLVKNNLVCLARMLVKETKGSVEVEYVSSHNHELNIQETVHHPMKEGTRNYIKRRLLLGISPAIILKELRGDVLTRETREEGKALVDRKLVLSQKTIRKIKGTIKYQLSPFSDDATSVKCLVHQLVQEAFNPVLLYKEQSLELQIGPQTEELKDLPVDLFALGIQTKQQMERYRLGASKILCIDSTQKANQYGFYLLNVVVPDEFGGGYPVAHFITNHRDEHSIQYFLRSLKERSPEANVSVVMTDDDFAMENAVGQVFGPTTHLLLCHWHVLRSWMKRLNELVTDDLVRTDIYQILYAALSEPSLDIFGRFCYNITEGFQTVAPLFVDYFQQDYMSRTKLWAKCYRLYPHGETDTNLYCESFHKSLKTFYSERKENKRLDDLLKLILQSEEDRFNQHSRRISEAEPLFIGEMIGVSLLRHEEGIRIPNEAVVRASDTEWFVQQHPEGKFSVKKIHSHCSEDYCFDRCLFQCCGGLCAHIYSCECEDKDLICKHKHKVQSLVWRSDSVAHFFLHPESTDHELVIEDNCSGEFEALGEFGEGSSLGCSKKKSLKPEIRKTLTKIFEQVPMISKRTEFRILKQLRDISGLCQIDASLPKANPLVPVHSKIRKGN